MLTNVLTLLLFPVIGIAWRFLKPGGITADALQRALTPLIHFVLLPLAVFFIMWGLPLNEAALRILLYVLGTTLLALAVAWLWLWKVNLAGKSKGALLIASGFGGIFYLGVPFNMIFYPDWTMRVAVEYGLVANVLLLFTLGAVLGRSFNEAGKSKITKAFAVLKDYKLWLTEPLVWATLLALILNMAAVEQPAWLKGIDAMIGDALVPLLLLSASLALNWSQAWNKRVVAVLPAVAIQLILVPLIMWGMVSLFGAAGVKTTQTLLLNSALPAAVVGFSFCERFKLDSSVYTQAFTAMMALSLVTVPLWAKILL